MGALSVAGHLAGAGVQAQSRRKQRGRREGDVGDGRFVNKLNFKLQFVNSIFSLFQRSNEKLLNIKLA